MPVGSYANLGGSCYLEINTTKVTRDLNKLKLAIMTRSYY